MNIYLTIVILIVFIALSILIGFLIDYFVIHKHFIKMCNNNCLNVGQLCNSTRIFSCTFFALLYSIFIFQIIILIIINNYYNKIRNRKDVSEALTDKRKKSLSASCSL